MSLFSIFKKKKEPVRFIAKTPLTWWIDDVECRVCALVDHPTLGLDKLPWPDCEKVYLAIDKTAYDELEQENKMMRECIDEIKPQLEWARMTIKDKLKFGMDESQAIVRRECRVNGVLITVLEELNKITKKEDVNDS
jgi:hypothetical protein